MKALTVHAGPRALAQLRSQRLQPHQVRAIPAAGGGPKGLVLNPLDRYLFGQWLDGQRSAVHLLGVSIGAWRMACACLDDPAAALAETADRYLHQSYEHASGQRPSARHVSEVFGPC